MWGERFALESGGMAGLDGPAGTHQGVLTEMLMHCNPLQRIVMFVPAAVGYPRLLRLLEPRLRPGAPIVADNADQCPPYFGAGACGRRWLSLGIVPEDVELCLQHSASVIAPGVHDGSKSAYCRQAAECR